MKLKSFIRSPRFLFFALAALLLISAVVYLLSPLPKPLPLPLVPVIATPTPPAGAAYQGTIIPNKTTGNELTQKMGEPTQKTIFKNQMLYSYPSSTARWFNQFYLDNNLVKLIIEPVFARDTRTKDSLFKKFGSPPLTLYGDLSTGGKDLFAYPSLGFAFLASNYTDIVYEVWYFPISSKEDFIVLAADHNYSPIEPTPKE